MLEGLDAVAWQTLEHAYGPAEDVPAQLRALLAPDFAQRQAARHALYGNIYHQGTVYEATAYAVPFLLELLGAATTPERPALAILLGHLAAGSSYRDVHQHVPIMREIWSAELGTAEWSASLDQELGWVAAARRAVLTGRPLYEALLADTDPHLRCAAAFVLAAFCDDDPAIAWDFRARLRYEDAPLARAALLCALAGVADREIVPDEFWRSRLRREREPLPRLIAALGAAQRFGAAMPKPALRVLVYTLAHPESVADAYRALPWTDEDVEAAACAALEWLGSEAQPALPLLAKTLTSTDSFTALSVAHTILVVAFGGQPVPAGVSAADLTEPQRFALRAIAASPAAWRFGGNLSAELRAFGLPERLEPLRLFLGQA